MSDEEDREVEFGTFDPVRAFEQTLFDLVQVVELFEPDDTAMTPKEFLNATAAAEERLKALVTITMAGVTGVVREKIPPEVMAEFRAEQDLDELMTSPEEKQKRMIKALRGIANWQRRPPRT
jgi:hypothetical protein